VRVHTVRDEVGSDKNSKGEDSVGLMYSSRGEGRVKRWLVNLGISSLYFVSTLSVIGSLA